MADDDADTMTDDADDDQDDAKRSWLQGAFGFTPPAPSDGSASDQGRDTGASGGDVNAEEVDNGGAQAADVPAGCQGAVNNLHTFIDDATGIGGPSCFYLTRGATLEFINRGSQPRTVQITNGIAASSSLTVPPGGNMSTVIVAGGGVGGSLMCDGINGGDRTVVDVVICPG